VSNRVIAIASVAGGAALLGFAPIGMRLSELGPQATAFWRFAFAFPVLTIAFAAYKPEFPAKRVPMLLLAGVFFAVDIALWHAALGKTTVVNATLASNMTPVIAAAAGWFLFRERITGIYLVGAAIAFAGAVMLSYARATGGGPMSGAGGLAGDLMGLAAAFWYALYLIVMRRERERVSARAAMMVTTFASTLVAFAIVFTAGETLTPTTARGWIIVASLGLVVQCGGQGLIAFGVGRLPIALSTVLLWIQPVAAAALSWMLFGEALGVLAFAGAALVLAGVFIAQRQSARKAPPPAPA
jgi:drug/metabolite transporter (DMT)-like permease